MKYPFLLVTIVIIISSLFNVNSQNKITSQINTIAIQWNSPVKAQLNNEYIDLLSFEGVNYNQDGLPVYNESIKVSASIGSAKISLLNTEFVELTDKELQAIGDLSLISSQIEINSTISTDRKIKFLTYSFIPLRKNKQTGKIERLNTFTISPIYKNNPYFALSHSYANHSVLSSGTWVKIAIQADGMYKLTFDELSEMGISNPANVRMFGNNYSLLSMANIDDSYDDLTEMAIRRGSNYILFYSKGPVSWKYNEAEKLFNQELHRYSDFAYYFLTSEIGVGLTIETENSVTSPNQFVSSFNAYAYHEQEDTNLIKSGRVLYGEEFGILDNIDFSFYFPNIVSSEPVKIKSSVIARATTTSSFYIKANGNLVSSLTGIQQVIIDPDAMYAYGKTSLDSFSINQDNITINVGYVKPNASAKGWLNYLCLNGRRHLKKEGSQMQFRDILSVDISNVSQFTIADANASVEIWDVTEVCSAKKIGTTLSGSNLSFTVPTDELREFIAFDGSSYLSIDSYEAVENQDIHGIISPDYVIVVPDVFLSYAEELAEMHRQIDGMEVLVVTNKQVYNEFSSGAPDITAIRNMMRMFYDVATNYDELPRYLLLFGDGSYDNKTEGNGNFILTYQSSNSLHPVSSFTTDDFFGFLDPEEGFHEGFLDIGIGRLPVSSETQAREAVDKIKNYISPSTQGDWRNILCFIADDSDGPSSNQHMQMAEGLCNSLHQSYPVLNFDKIYLDAYPQEHAASGERYPDAELAIENRLKKGALIINYTGHGNELGLTHEQVIKINDILNWKNYDKLPLFMTATCEFSRFDDYGRTSGGELVFLNNKGGGIALFTTTRPVYPSPIGQNFYGNVFEKVDGKHYCLGDLVRITKNETGSSANMNKRKYVLLGDPALMLAYPKYKVKTSTVNGSPIISNTDTLKAMSFVTITGYIADLDGDTLTSFNGFVNPLVFDKSKVLLSLGNEGNTPMPYDSQKNILYKGKSSVTNGKFSFSFIVPKDISYNYGYGKLSYYAHNDTEDAAGSSNNIIIGGSLDNANIDVVGPTMEIYMNNSDFIDGGMTDENPKILVYIQDSTGINTVGNGIGHDIVGVIDNSSTTTYNLNDYYQADLDSYRSGKIEYQLSNLKEGSHSLSMRVWDVYNNSSIDSIEFIVAESAEMAIKRLFNYPNPFTQSTDFYFEQNQVNTDIEVLIQIFTVSGRLVKTLEADMFADGYRVGPIHWDGLDDFGNLIGRGVYIYKVKLRTAEGKNITKLEKLVILK